MKDKISEQRIALLHPKIKDEVLNLLNQAETIIDSNLAIRVVQGLRTIEEQDALYAQGRTKPGNIVTNAKGGSSYHNYGLAIDICWLFKQPDGTYKYDDVKSWKTGSNFFKVIKSFKEAGYTWGGDWEMQDTPHFQKSFGLSWKELYKKYLAKDFIENTNYIRL